MEQWTFGFPYSTISLLVALIFISLKMNEVKHVFNRPLYIIFAEMYI